MLKTAQYIVTPHSKVRNHKIPREAVRSLLPGKAKSLDGQPCLIEIMLILRGRNVPRVLNPIIVKPNSGDEIFVGKRDCPEYPDKFGPGDFLFIRLTPLRTGPTD